MDSGLSSIAARNSSESSLFVPFGFSVVFKISSLGESIIESSTVGDEFVLPGSMIVGKPMLDFGTLSISALLDMICPTYDA